MSSMDDESGGAPLLDFDSSRGSSVSSGLQVPIIYSDFCIMIFNAIDPIQGWIWVGVHTAHTPQEIFRFL